MEKDKLKPAIIESADGSHTLRVDSLNETYHSHKGAITESFHVFLKMGLALFSDKNCIQLLEVGFGTGLGFLETLKALEEIGPFKFYSFEIDENLVKHFFETHDFSFEKQGNHYVSINEHFELRILVGNAREEIKKIDEKFQVIYQDAFSPKRNAILWTTEWFLDLKKISTSDCIMSTYSSSSSIRKSMLAADWKLSKGEQFGPKRSSTRASLVGESDPEILAHLNRSPAPTLTDKNYLEYKI